MPIVDSWSQGIKGLIACILIIYHSIPIKDEQSLASWFSVLGISMITGVMLGGIASGYIIENYIINYYTNKWQIWGGIIGSIIISPLSMEYGTVTGTLGISIGIMLNSLPVIGKCLPSLGLVITMTTFIIICECIGAITGSVIGLFVHKIFLKIF